MIEPLAVKADAQIVYFVNNSYKYMKVFVNGTKVLCPDPLAR